jgi:hypothetical protein
MMLPLGVSPDGSRVAEIGAFCVDVVFRGTGRGDSLLDYVEQVCLRVSDRRGLHNASRSLSGDFLVSRSVPQHW